MSLRHRILTEIYSKHLVLEVKKRVLGLSLQMEFVVQREISIVNFFLFFIGLPDKLEKVHLNLNFRQ